MLSYGTEEERREGIAAQYHSPFGLQDCNYNQGYGEIGILERKISKCRGDQLITFFFFFRSI